MSDIKNNFKEDLTLEKNPKVSVIIPTHNHAHFLRECLSSVKNQTYKDYEVILVNNGSTDNTEEVVCNFKCDKLRYHYQNDTGSVAGPRNTGIRLAKGKYVAFLDSDDLWYEKKLEKVMNILESDHSIDIISHDLFLTREGKEKKIMRCGPLKENMVNSLLVRNCLLGSATLVKRSAMLEVGGFDESKDFVHAEDCEVWIRIAYLGKRFHFINEVLGEYRVHSANLSNDFEGLLRNERNLIKKHFKKFKSSFPLHCYLFYCNRISNVYFKLATQYFFRKKYIKSIQSLISSFLFNPLYLPYNVISLIKSIR